MQEIIIGIDALEKILKKIGSKKYLLVCGLSFSFLSIKNDFTIIDIPHVRFDEFTPNPLYEHVCKGVVLFNEEKCDTIIAVGGGSTIDVAKCIKLYNKMDPSQNYMIQEYKDTGIPLIAIPTTAGTGSESTQHAVIYFEGKKQSIYHESILPNYAILEPSVLKTLPDYQKKCTMLDALCQGIESWWSVNSNNESKEYSKVAVELILQKKDIYIKENKKETAKQIMLAANFSGRAINITQTTAAHAMSYKITSMYKLPHGHAVAVCLPEVWEYMIANSDKCIDLRGANYLQGIFKDISKSMGCNDAMEACVLFRTMMTELEMKAPVSSDRDKDIKILTGSVNPARLKNNPIALSSEVLDSLYQRIVK
jgi:alcohol dehydrogenase class IV